MDSFDKPSIGGILRPIDKSVNAKADNYLKYFKEDKDGDDNLGARKLNSLDVVNSYYDLATDFYEYGYGESFHFAVMNSRESREHSFAKYEYNLALKLELKPRDLVLDIGCGVGGPARHIASFSGSKIVGLNCNDYQLNRARVITQKAKLDHLCSFVKGDYHSLEFEENSFDKAYAIEATVHSPDLAKVYGQVYRVLKPGGLFVCCEWVMTDKFNPSNRYHKKLKDDILVGDGLPDIASIPQVHEAIKKVGFEVVEARDQSEDSTPPWYSVLLHQWTLSDIKITPFGRWVTHLMLIVLETIWLAPKGSVKVHKTLCKGADALAAAGIEEIFSPMYVMVLRKPDVS